MMRLFIALLFALGCFFLCVHSVDAAINVSACGTLSNPNEVYTLTSDVYSTGTCFTMTANNVALDLNGYTIHYANSTSGYGLYLGNGGAYSGFTIHNGAIVGGHQDQSHAIYFGDGDRNNMLVYDLTISVGGVESNGISFSSTQNVNIHDVDITMDSQKVDQCSHYGGHIVGIGLSHPSGNIDIYNNSITGNGMLGISVSDCIDPFSEDMLIHDNYVSLWSPVRDGYALVVAGRNNSCSGGTQIYNNTIDQVNGRGIIVAGYDLPSDYGPGNVEIYQNNITVREGWDCEYDAAGSGIGIRLRFGAHDVYTHDNEIYGFAGTGVAVGSEPTKDGSEAFGIYTGSGSPYGLNNSFVNNYVEVTTNDSRYSAIALYVGGGNPESPSLPSTYTNNTLKSNNMPVRIGYNDGGGYNASFDSNTIIKAANPYNFHTYTIGYWIMGSTNVDFSNTQTSGGADPYDLYFSGSCDGVCAQFEDITVSWILRTEVTSTSGSALAGATVSIKNSENQIVASGTTNASGVYETNIVDRTYAGEVTASFVESTPHTVIISRSGYQSITASVTMSESKTLKAALVSTSSPDEPTVIVEEYVEPVQSPVSIKPPTEIQRTITNIVARQWFFAYNSSLRGGYFVTAGNVLGDSMDEIVTGTDSGLTPQVRVFDSQGVLKSQFFAYDRNLRNGVTVSACDIDGNGIDEIVTAQAHGGWPLVKIFNGYGVTINNGFYVLDRKFTGGVNIACGDTNGDGISEIVVGAMRGGGPQVMVYSATGRVLTNFMAYDPRFRGGINVTTADADGDGRDEIITGPQWGAPHVQIFQIRPNEIKRLSPGFFAFNPGYRGGVQVAGVDTDGDGTKEIAVGVGDNATSFVKIYDIRERWRNEFFVYASNFLGGVRLGGGDVDGDGKDELLAIPRSVGGPNLRIIEGEDM